MVAQNTGDAFIYRAQTARKKLENSDKEQLKEAVKTVKKAQKSRDKQQLVPACSELSAMLETLSPDEGADETEATG